MLAIASIAILFAACKKDAASPKNETPVSTEKFPVSVSIADFIRTVENLPMSGARSASGQLKDTALGSKVSHIVYLAYPQGVYTPVSTFRQSVNENPVSFGTIRDSLPAGNYTLVIVASHDSLQVSNAGIFYIPRAGMNGIENFGDIFAKRIYTTVTAGGLNQIEDITLPRAIGKLEVNILDGEALEASNHEITVTARSSNYMRNVLEDYTYLDHDGIITTLQRVSGKKYESFVLDREDFMVTITVKDKSTGDVVLSKLLTDISVGINKKTIISGNLTGSNTNTNGNWDLRVNQTWDSDVIVEF